MLRKTIQIGFTLTLFGLWVVPADAVTNLVNTVESTVTLLGHDGNGLNGQRVDLLKENGSGAGLKETTALVGEASGVAAFEVLPNFRHGFRVYLNGGTFVTGVVDAEEDVVVQAHLSQLILADASGNTLKDVRVDLLRPDSSSTGQKAYTDAGGKVGFEVLPGCTNRFRIRYNAMSFITELVPCGQILTLDLGVQIPEIKLVLLDTLNAAIDGVQIDLLKSDGKGTGVKANTGDSGPGSVVFPVLPDASHKLRIRYNGSLEIVDVVAGAVVEIQTVTSSLTVTGAGAPVAGVRVDLFRVKDDGSAASTGKRATTDANGVATMQVLPTFVHRLQARVGKVRFTTADLVGTEDDVIDIDTDLPDGAQATRLAVEDADGATAFGLDQNFPNPFNPSTTIGYSLPEAVNVRLVIYNILGQEVRELVNMEQAAGRHRVRWDGRDVFGRQVATGLYISRLVAGSNVAIGKMTFSK